MAISLDPTLVPVENTHDEAGHPLVTRNGVSKHLLQNTWAFWYTQNDSSKTWRDNLLMLSKFDTVEDFWALYNHICACSELKAGRDYSLSKDGVEPTWEDESNETGGGRWLITIPKKTQKGPEGKKKGKKAQAKAQEKPQDRIWLETLLCLLGEAFDHHTDDVCGAVVNVREKEDRISLWLTQHQNEESIAHVGRIYKERMCALPPGATIAYQPHAGTTTKTDSTALRTDTTTETDGTNAIQTDTSAQNDSTAIQTDSTSIQTDSTAIQTDASTQQTNSTPIETHQSLQRAHGLSHLFLYVFNLVCLPFKQFVGLLPQLGGGR